MSEKMLFIYNPRAGKAVKAVRERHAGYDLVVCSGGDGTLDEVVSGMMRCDETVPIGYVPAGSTNDFANSLGIPKNMIAAADVVVNGRDFACDIGSFNHDSFIYVAAFGLFTDVSYETKQDIKNVLGHAAYLLEGVKRLPAVRSYALKITHDEEVLEGEFLYGMITNSYSVGGFRGITGKDVLLDDGLFEVMLVRRPGNPLEINNIIRALVDKRVKSEHIYTFKTQRLIVESEEPLSWTLDGEFGGEHTKAVIENRRQVLRIRIPQN